LRCVTKRITSSRRRHSRCPSPRTTTALACTCSRLSVRSGVDARSALPATLVHAGRSVHPRADVLVRSTCGGFSFVVRALPCNDAQSCLMGASTLAATAVVAAAAAWREGAGPFSSATLLSGCCSCGWACDQGALCSRSVTRGCCAWSSRGPPESWFKLIAPACAVAA
jgi:hypothetical protein